jgi:hypothetical protein
MMTADSYIKQRFQSFGIDLSEADLLDMKLSSKVSGDDEISEGNTRAVNIAIVQYIPSLMLRYNSKSVSENGFSKSLSWDISGIKAYYSMMCKKYGLKDELNQEKPKIKFL